MRNSLLQDLSLTIRSLRKNLRFAVLSILCLGIGIGGTTAVFSIANTLFLRSLTHGESARLVRIYLSYDKGLRWGVLSFPEYEALRDQNEVLEELAAARISPLSFSHQGVNERIYGSIVTANYFELLQLEPGKGRYFQARDGESESDAAVAVLGHKFWRSHLGGNLGVVDSLIHLNGHPFRVLGVAPPDFRGLHVGFSPDVWVPVASERLLVPGTDILQSRDTRLFFAIGQLREGVGLAVASEGLNRVATQLATSFPEVNKGTSFTVIPAQEGNVYPLYKESISAVITILLAVVGLVLLIACANVAALLLVRGDHRKKELAVRAALGASRSRLVRMLLVESLVLSFLAGGVGLLLAAGVAHLMNSLGAMIRLPVELGISIDTHVLAFAFLVSVVTAMIFGLVPALRTVRQDPFETLKDANAGAGSGLSFLHRSMVIAQIALSLILLVSAGLLLRGLLEAQSVELGFKPDNVYVASVDLGVHGYSRSKGLVFYRELVQRVEGLPGVETASLSLSLPLSLFGPQREVAQEGGSGPDNAKTLVDFNVVSPGYFEALGISIIGGRDFSLSDTESAPKVAVINRTLAERLWPGEEAVGRRIDSEGDFYTVVGVADNAKYISLAEEEKSYLYLPVFQEYISSISLLARAERPMPGLLATLRQEVQTLDGSLSLFNEQSLNDHLKFSLLPARVGAAVVGGFSILALLLAAIGLYGAISYSLSLRQREIGIRMAMGAEPRRILVTIIRQGLILFLIGSSVGLVVALAVTRLLAQFLYGLDSFDLVTFAAVVGLLGLVAVVASYGPARLATQLDLTAVLRQE